MTRAAYLVDGIRTPIGRYGGALAAVRPDDLAAHAVSALLARHASLDPATIDDVILGCANQAGEDNRNVARMSLLLAGLPDSVPGTTINRLCGSGMDAVITAARAIKAQAIRYRSARDPAGGINLALLDPGAFGERVPRIEHSWHLRFVDGRLTALAAFPSPLSFSFAFEQFGLAAP